MENKEVKELRKNINQKVSEIDLFFEELVEILNSEESLHFIIFLEQLINRNNYESTAKKNEG